MKNDKNPLFNHYQQPTQIFNTPQHRGEAEVIMTSPEDSNPRRNLLWVSNWLRKWLKRAWWCDFPRPLLLDVNKHVPPQFDIGWEELLGKVPQVPAISAPSGRANDYAGFIIQEGIDSLLLEASQVFERVNVKRSDEHDKLFL